MRRRVGIIAETALFCMKSFLYFILLVTLFSCSSEHSELAGIIQRQKPYFSYQVAVKNKALFTQDTILTNFDVYLRQNSLDTVYGYDFRIIDGSNLIFNRENELYIFNTKNLTYRVVKKKLSSLKKLLLPNHNLRIPDLKDTAKTTIEYGVYTYSIVKKYEDTEEVKDMVEKYEISIPLNNISKILTALSFQGGNQYDLVSYSNFDYSARADFDQELNNLKDSFELFKKDKSYQNPIIEEFIDIAGIDLDSNKLLKISEFPNKVVILDFWYRSCYPCLKSIPFLNKLYKKYSDKGLTILGINPVDDIEKSAVKMNQFKVEKGIEYPLLFTKNNEYGIKEYPTLILLDMNKKILYTKIGYNIELEAELTALIDDFLKY